MKGVFIDLGYKGLFINGVFVGADENIRIYDQKERLSYSYLVTVGSNAYKINSDHDYRGRLAFGDVVTFAIRTRAFNNQVYYNGDLVDE